MARQRGAGTRTGASRGGATRGDGSAAQTIVDSPVGWVARHIRAYVESGGATTGYGGRPLLLLTTRGRKSGRRHRTALIYGRDGDRYLVVPSNGGSSKHPQWYLNLRAHPEVEVQVGPEVFTARARPAVPAEKPRLWMKVVEIFPPYAGMQKKTKREIPVVVIDRDHGARAGDEAAAGAGAGDEVAAGRR